MVQKNLIKILAIGTVSKVTNMSAMFYSAYNFNADISDWDVSNVTDMNMFYWASNFNRDLSKWDVDKVTELSWF